MHPRYPHSIRSDPGRWRERLCELPQDPAEIPDALAEALDPASATFGAANAVLERFPWARPTDIVSSVIVTTPIETPIRPSEGK